MISKTVLVADNCTSLFYAEKSTFHQHLKRMGQLPNCSKCTNEYNTVITLIIISLFLESVNTFCKKFARYYKKVIFKFRRR